MKIIKRIGIGIASILVVLVGCNLIFTKSYTKENPFVKAQDGTPLVIAHGGAKHLEPENTMRAFRNAVAMGVDVLEIDIMMTSDGVLVTHHGQNESGNIDLMSNASGLVHEMSFDELQAFNFGYNFQALDGSYPYRDVEGEEIADLEINIPALEQVFATFGNRVLYVLEIKAEAGAKKEEAVDALYELIDQYDVAEVSMVATFYDDINAYYYASRPDIAISTSVGPTTNYIVSNLFYLPFLFQPKGHAALQMPLEESAPVIGTIDLTQERFIKQAQKQNMAVHYWTINDVETMQRLIDLGVDGIITDRPDLLLTLLGQ
ncbi:MAG: glycerophosphodiester phosphodiesterase [Erysipelotrichaceae bacterium]